MKFLGNDLSTVVGGMLRADKVDHQNAAVLEALRRQIFLPFQTRPGLVIVMAILPTSRHTIISSVRPGRVVINVWAYINASDQK